MITKTERVEARLSPEERSRIEEAAEVAGESMSSFIVIAAVGRADEIIANKPRQRRARRLLRPAPRRGR